MSFPHNVHHGEVLWLGHHLILIWLCSWKFALFSGIIPHLSSLKLDGPFHLLGIPFPASLSAAILTLHPRAAALQGTLPSVCRALMSGCSRNHQLPFSCAFPLERIYSPFYFLAEPSLSPQFPDPAHFPSTSWQSLVFGHTFAHCWLMKDFTPCQCLELVWEHWEDRQLLGELMQFQFLLCPCSIPNPSQMCSDVLDALSSLAGERYRISPSFFNHCCWKQTISR